MSFIVNLYKKNFLQRFDKDPAIPYYSVNDFPNLQCEENSFVNSLNTKICYFTYFYKDFKKADTILFCPGIGPGHTAYLTEIELLCKNGYKVITLDYMGCGASDGERLPSINEPTRDVIELLCHLNLKDGVILVGHSLGAYTGLNVINKTSFIHKAVIISGFVDIASEMLGFVKLSLLANKVKKFEKKLNPEYGSIDNWEYLKNTDNELLFIHSLDDRMVNYKFNTGKVAGLNNPHIKIHTVDGKKHNPNYSMDAIKFMNESMGGYEYLIKEGKLNTLEERVKYFKDKPIGKMTEQDKEVWDVIFDFIGK